jgi:hypothetical protein
MSMYFDSCIAVRQSNMFHEENVCVAFSFLPFFLKERKGRRQRSLWHYEWLSTVCTTDDEQPEKTRRKSKRRRARRRESIHQMCLVSHCHIEPERVSTKRFSLACAELLPIKLTGLWLKYIFDHRALRYEIFRRDKFDQRTFVVIRRVCLSTRSSRSTLSHLGLSTKSFVSFSASERASETGILGLIVCG